MEGLWLSSHQIAVVINNKPWLDGQLALADYIFFPVDIHIDLWDSTETL